MFCKNTQVSNITKILPVEANFVTKLTVAFRNFFFIVAMNSTAKLTHLLSIFSCLTFWKDPEVNSIKSTGVVWYVGCRKEATMQACL